MQGQDGSAQYEALRLSEKCGNKLGYKDPRLARSGRLPLPTRDEDRLSRRATTANWEDFDTISSLQTFIENQNHVTKPPSGDLSMVRKSSEFPFVSRRVAVRIPPQVAITRLIQPVSIAS